MRLLLKLFALIPLFALLSSTALAQKSDYFDKGTVTYSIKSEGMDEASFVLDETSIELIFDGNKAKMDFVMMAGMIRLQLIQNDKQTILMDMPFFDKSPAVDVGKDWMKLLEDESRRNQAPIKTDDITIVYDHKDRKRIAGYRCHRADIKAPDGSVIQLYVCPRLRPQSFSLMGDAMKKIEGLPMSIEIRAQGKSLLIQANEVNDKRPAATLFDIPNTYSKMTLDEFRKMIQNNFQDNGVGL